MPHALLADHPPLPVSPYPAQHPRKRFLAPGSASRALAVYVGAAALSLVVVAWALRLWRADLTVPLYYGGDCLLVHAWVKSQVDNPWYLHNAYLGMPDGLDMHDFPASDGLQFLLLKLLALATGDYAVTGNVYFLLGFPLTTLSALFVLRRLGLSHATAVVFALLYAFLPYHFLRNQGHLFLGSYYLIPPLVLVALRVYREPDFLFYRDEARRKTVCAPWGRRSLAALGTCALVSSAGAYYAIFGCYFLLVAGIASALQRRRPHPLGLSLLLTTVIALGMLANAVPHLVYRAENGVNHDAVLRNPAESEIYGLKVVQVILPVGGHRVPFLAGLRERYDDNRLLGPPFINENSSAALGTVGACGFLVLLGRLAYRRPGAGGPGWLDGLCLLNVAAVLLATIGGLGTVASFLGAHWVRGYNRVSVYLGFFAVAAVGLLLERLARRHARPPRARLAYHAGLAVLLAGGLLDQTTDRFVPAYKAVRHEHRRDAAFVRSVEAAVPEGSLVFQLPYVQFVEHIPPHRMASYDHLRAYLASKTLRWSYGAMKGRESDLWQAHVAARPPARLARALALAGFRGVWIDRHGYADNAAELEAGLARALEAAPLESGDKRLAFYDLGPYAEALRRGHSAESWAAEEDEALHPLLVSWGAGFEGSGWAHVQFGRGCSGVGELYVINRSARTRTATLEMDCRTARPGKANLWLGGPLVERRVEISEDPVRVVERVTVPPGKHLVRFTTDARGVVAGMGDGSALAMRVVGPVLRPDE